MPKFDHKNPSQLILNGFTLLCLIFKSKHEVASSVPICSLFSSICCCFCMIFLNKEYNKQKSRNVSPGWHNAVGLISCNYAISLSSLRRCMGYLTLAYLALPHRKDPEVLLNVDKLLILWECLLYMETFTSHASLRADVVHRLCILKGKN